MRIPGWFFWLLFFLVATFCWFVYFEHGPGLQSFGRGAGIEIDRLWNAAIHWLRNSAGSS